MFYIGKNSTVITKPSNIDMQKILIERDLRIQHNITARISERERLLPAMDIDDQRMRKAK